VQTTYTFLHHQVNGEEATLIDDVELVFREAGMKIHKFAATLA
jgi:hypothetical protein